MDVRLNDAGYAARMEKEFGTHSEVESPARILLSPFYLAMLAGVAIAGTLFASLLFI